MTLPQRGDLRRRQRLAFGRHALGFIRRGYALQQEAIRRIAWLDGCTTFPSFNRQRGSIEPQARFLLECAMTCDTSLCEEGLDLLEIIDLHIRCHAVAG